MKGVVYLGIVMALLLAVLLPACAQPSPAAPPASAPKTSPTAAAKPVSAVTPQSGGVFKTILTSATGIIGSLGAPTDVYKNSSGYGRTARPALESLITFDAAGRFKPLLAQSWDIPADGKSITLHLQKGVKFHDGTPFNAEAAKYNFEQLKNDPNNATNRATYAKATSFDILDEFTIRVNLTEYDARMPLTWYQAFMVSPTALKIKSPPETEAKDHMVGTGPFTFVDYKAGQFVKYKKFPGYWQQGKPYLDGIEITQIADTAVAIISFKAGDAQQIFNITPRDAQDLEKAGYEIFTSDLWSSYYMIPDGVNQDSPFYNIKVRQAAEYAIDRKSIAKAVGLGYYEAISQMATSHTASYVPELKPRDYDPAMAKKLLADAGYPQGFKTKLIATSSFNKDVLVAVQTYLKEVGIEATLDLADQVRLTSISNEGWKNGLFVNSYPTSSDILSLGRAHLAPTAVVSMYRGDMQKYLDAAAKEPDVDKRTAQLKSVVKTIYDNAAAIPLWGQPNINARYKNLHDVHWSVGGHVELWTPADAWLSK